jgi:DHA2 family multidrug resistance protein
LHINYLSKNVNPTSLQARQMLQGLQAHFISMGADPVDAMHRAYGALWGMVQHQASMLAYNDSFFFLAILFALMFPFVLLLRRPKGGGPVIAH